jgi:hypothetical protein
MMFQPHLELRFGTHCSTKLEGWSWPASNVRMTGRVTRLFNLSVFSCCTNPKTQHDLHVYFQNTRVVDAYNVDEWLNRQDDVE